MVMFVWCLLGDLKYNYRKCIPQAYIYAHWISQSPSHLTGCQILAISKISGSKNCPKPFLCILAFVCFLITMVTNRHATGCPFALIGRPDHYHCIILLLPSLLSLPFSSLPARKANQVVPPGLVLEWCNGNWCTGNHVDAWLITQLSLSRSPSGSF